VLKLIGSERYNVTVIAVKLSDIIFGTRRYQNQWRCPAFKAALLTGHGAIDAHVEGMEFGANAYLFRPVTVIELVWSVQDCCKGKDH
jgi:DNA-binding response OmpR family regulator